MDFFTLVGLTAFFYFLVYSVTLWLFNCDLQLAFVEKFGKKLVKLRGKVVWITSASTELGKMMALKVARNHGKLVLSSKSLKHLEKLESLCLKKYPFLRAKDILLLEFHIEELSGHRRALEKVLRHFGRLDILILNENKWEKSPWEETLPTVDHLLFQSNVFSILSLSRLVIRYFNIKQKGKLAITSSIAGLIGVPYSGSYTATKHALHGYFNSLRFEKLGDNIQATLLCLGSNELAQDELSNSRKLTDLETEPRKKMTAERCAHLCLTAIVNDLEEVWMAIFPILPLVYGIKYFPNCTKILLKYLKTRGT